MERDDELKFSACDRESNEAVTGVHRLETLPAELLVDVRETVARFYDNADLRPGDDPCRLFEYLEIWPCPLDCHRPYVRQRILYYPDRHSLEVRGAGLFELFGRILCPRASRAAMRELILPESVALCVDEKNLASVQPHAPIDLVEEIFFFHQRQLKKLTADPSSRTILRAVPRIV